MSDQNTQAAHPPAPAHATADHHEHPTWKQYKWVAFWLTLITAVEVWVYYTPFKESSLFAPTLLVMSAVKFTMVVAYYMHIKYDHWIFKRLFLLGLSIATVTILALLFLFGKLKIGG
ncbi:MAG: cytochrome C oxidase subunit IV family protein [Gemmatimonadetes bacterium]|nr:cytochrome C oxidase subunit IV family protein [Gemmatimonadota bacterium]